MTDERLKKSVDAGRTSRAMEGRAVTENRLLSDDDRIRMYNESFFQDALPDLPKLPGFHVCWVSTTNDRDTPHSRQRLGYELISKDEYPGWDHMTLKSGSYEGFIGLNEMVAMKIPVHLYEHFMMISHHKRPQEEQAMLADRADGIAEEARRKGSNVSVGDGLLALRSTPRAPTFAA